MSWKERKPNNWPPRLNAMQDHCHGFMCDNTAINTRPFNKHLTTWLPHESHTIITRSQYTILMRSPSEPLTIVPQLFRYHHTILTPSHIELHGKAPRSSYYPLSNIQRSPHHHPLASWSPPDPPTRTHPLMRSASSLVSDDGNISDDEVRTWL